MGGLDSRRSRRPARIGPSESNRRTKRLKGLDEFAPPPFVGRMERIRLRRERAFHGALLIAVLVGVGLGLTLF
jgi:hypothetical protein